MSKIEPPSFRPGSSSTVLVIVLVRVLDFQPALVLLNKGDPVNEGFLDYWFALTDGDQARARLKKGQAQIPRASLKKNRRRDIFQNLSLPPFGQSPGTGLCVKPQYPTTSPSRSATIYRIKPA
jgi:hypothetical protein